MSEPCAERRTSGALVGRSEATAAGERERSAEARFGAQRFLVRRRGSSSSAARNERSVLGHQERSDCCHPSVRPAAHVQPAAEHRRSAHGRSARDLRDARAIAPATPVLRTGGRGTLRTPVAAEAVGRRPPESRHPSPPMPRALTQAEIDHYREHGWLRIERRVRGRGARRARPRPRLADRDVGRHRARLARALAPGLHGRRDRGGHAPRRDARRPPLLAGVGARDALAAARRRARGPARARRRAPPLDAAREAARHRPPVPDAPGRAVLPARRRPLRRHARAPRRHERRERLHPLPRRLPPPRAARAHHARRRLRAAPADRRLPARRQRARARPPRRRRGLPPVHDPRLAPQHDRAACGGSSASASAIPTTASSAASPCGGRGRCCAAAVRGPRARTRSRRRSDEHRLRTWTRRRDARHPPHPHGRRARGVLPALPGAGPAPARPRVRRGQPDAGARRPRRAGPRRRRRPGGERHA